MSKNTLRISSFDCLYDYQSGNIQLTSKDKKLRGKPLKITLSNRTEGYDALYSALDEAGLVDHSLTLPELPLQTDFSVLEVAGEDPRFCFNLGMGFKDQPFSVDMRRTPHMLITGGTGTGKTTLQRSIALHCLNHSQSMDIELYGVDFNRVELEPYFRGFEERLATTLEEAYELFRALELRFEERLTELESLGVANVSSSDLPAIYVIVDSLYDIFVAKDFRETPLASKIKKIYEKIIQQGRIAGFFLIGGTQRTDVISGLIRANSAVKILVGRSTLYYAQSALDLPMEVEPMLGLLRSRGTAIASVFGEKSAFSVYSFPQRPDI